MAGKLVMDWSYTNCVKCDANTLNSTKIMVETSTVSQVLLGTYDRPSPPQSLHSIHSLPVANHHAQEEEEKEVEPPKVNSNKKKIVEDWLFPETFIFPDHE